MTGAGLESRANSRLGKQANPGLIVAVGSSMLALKSDPQVYNLLRPKNGLDIGGHFPLIGGWGTHAPTLRGLLQQNLLHARLMQVNPPYSISDNKYETRYTDLYS